MTSATPGATSSSSSSTSDCFLTSSPNAPNTAGLPRGVAGMHGNPAFLKDPPESSSWKAQPHVTSTAAAAASELAFCLGVVASSSSSSSSSSFCSSSSPAGCDDGGKAACRGSGVAGEKGGDCYFSSLEVQTRLEVARRAAEARSAAAARIFASAQMQSEMRAKEEALREASPLRGRQRRSATSTLGPAGASFASSSSSSSSSCCSSCVPALTTTRGVQFCGGGEVVSERSLSQHLREVAGRTPGARGGACSREDRSGSRRGGGRTKQRRWLRQQLLLAAASALRWQSSFEKKDNEESEKGSSSGEGLFASTSTSYWTRLLEDCATLKLFLKRQEPPLPSDFLDEDSLLNPESLFERQTLIRQQTRRRYVRLVERLRRLLLLSLQKRPHGDSQKKLREGHSAERQAAGVCFSEGEDFVCAVSAPKIFGITDGTMSAVEEAPAKGLMSGRFSHDASSFPIRTLGSLAPVRVGSLEEEAFESEALQLAGMLARIRDALRCFPDSQLSALPSVQRLLSVRATLKGLRLKLKNTPRIFALAFAFEALLQRQKTSLAEGATLLRACRKSLLLRQTEKETRLPAGFPTEREQSSPDDDSQEEEEDDGEEEEENRDQGVFSVDLKNFVLASQNAAVPFCVPLETSSFSQGERMLAEALRVKAPHSRSSGSSVPRKSWILLWRLSALERTILHALVSLCPMLHAVSLSLPSLEKRQFKGQSRSKLANSGEEPSAKVVVLCRRTQSSEEETLATPSCGVPLCLSALLAAAVAAPV